MNRTLALTFLLLPLLAFARNDTLWLDNGNVLYGEIKGLSSGILTMETPYSDKDFAIEYHKVERMFVEATCLIILTGGRRMNGFLRSEASGQVTISSTEGAPEVFPLKEITSFQTIEKRVWDRFYGNLDIGFNLAKANNNRQLNVNGGVHYRGFRWFSDFDVSSLTANRDDVEQTERTNMNLGITRMLTEKWYIMGTGSFLSNTEQNLQGRWGGRIGGGRYLANTSKLMFGITAGFNYNIESYQDENLNKESMELYLSTNLNMFDFKDFSLNTRLDLYPSLSERGRVRSDFQLDVKYDLPYDFYVSTGFQYNYDNQVVEGGSPFDYVFTTGFGWKFD
ncbi:DUF481 domain-containing protein [Robiginitalea marina]|uniref:DUF481 domain-containing protein n=1 Tax=Robiginitalea marina TaxID=2954105 RepID=A0ABT1B1C7_9FLAO|nr:DUF481 domain-containing protein [Robiginitalea marina]MCO5726051.1 DUF481 domain-containing protein [Robiginitalea marina]